MCCCGTPTINGTLGYRWQPNDTPSTRRTDPPTIQDGDTILFDEPGRCGGLDSHHLHCMLVKARFGGLYILVRHGCGDERIQLSPYANLTKESLAAMDSSARYWMLATLWSAYRDGADEAQKKESATWRKAAAEKRIKTRKYPTKGIKVWIESAALVLMLLCIPNLHAAAHKAPAITTKTAVVKAEAAGRAVYIIRKTSGQWIAVSQDGTTLSLAEIGIVADAVGLQIELLHADTAATAAKILAAHASNDWTYSAAN